MQISIYIYQIYQYTDDLSTNTHTHRRRSHYSWNLPVGRMLAAPYFEYSDIARHDFLLIFFLIQATIDTSHQLEPELLIGG